MIFGECWNIVKHLIISVLSGIIYCWFSVAVTEWWNTRVTLFVNSWRAFLWSCKPAWQGFVQVYSGVSAPSIVQQLLPKDKCDSFWDIIKKITMLCPVRATFLFSYLLALQNVFNPMKCHAKIFLCWSLNEADRRKVVLVRIDWDIKMLLSLGTT